jgi:hypothetical protein
VLAATGLPARVQPRVLGLALVPLALLAFAHLLPTTGAGAGVRMLAASIVVLLLPGALVLRALCWPKTVGVALAGSFLLSLGVAAVALAATFALGRSFSFGLGVGALITLVALGFAVIGEPSEFERSDVLAALGVALAVIPIAVPFWLAHDVVNGDDLFHLGRMVKLTELPALTSLSAVGEFRDGGLHPGYAFPLWHAVIAAVQQLAGVSGATAVLHFGQAFAPISCVIAYGLGRTLFGAWTGGVAVAVAQIALWVSQGRSGAMRTLSDPETAARSVVPVAIVVLVLVYLEERRLRLLIPIGCGALALAIIHPNYPLYLLLLLAGFLLADLAVNRRPATTKAIALAAAAIAAPTIAFVLALWPVISDNVDQANTAGLRDFRTYYASSLDGSWESFRESPGALTRNGAGIVIALLALPLAALAARRLWGAFAAGGSAVILILALTPALFTPFAKAVSVGQAVRLAAFLPLAIAIAGLAVLVSRGRLLSVALAVALGIGLVLAYPGEWTFYVVHPGPTWPVWLGLAGVIAGLAFAAWRRPDPPGPTAWTAAIAVALAVPVLVSFLVRLNHDNPDRFGLTPGLVTELRALPPGSTVFASPAVSYRVLAAAPVYVADAPRLHVALTTKNRVEERARDNRKFFASGTSPQERRAILADYGASWLVLDRSQARPGEIAGPIRCAYSDGRYELFSVEPGAAESSLSCP